MSKYENDDNPYVYTDHGTDHEKWQQGLVEEILVDGFHLKLTQEVYFTTKSLVLPLICVLPLFLFFPLGISMFFWGAFANLLEFLSDKNQFNEEWMLYLILWPVVMLLFVFYAPWFLLADFWVSWLVARFHSEPLKQNEYICQFTTNPRRYHGSKEHRQRAKLEDADDLGILSLEEDRMVFQGDHTFFSLSYREIQFVNRTRRFGNSLGLGGYYIRVYSERLNENGYQYVQFADRRSKTVPAAYRLSRKIYEEILIKLDKG